MIRRTFNNTKLRFRSSYNQRRNCLCKKTYFAELADKMENKNDLVILKFTVEISSKIRW